MNTTVIIYVTNSAQGGYLVLVFGHDFIRFGMIRWIYAKQWKWGLERLKSWQNNSDLDEKSFETVLLEQAQHSNADK